MKKLLCLLLCAVMLFSVVACNDGETPPVDSSSESSSSSSSSSSSTPGYTEPEDTYTAWDTEGYHIYVSPNGHDANDGLAKETAVETIVRANEIAREYVAMSTSNSEDVVIALEGGRHYVGEMIYPVSGTDDVHVYYTSYGDKKAELVGAYQIGAEEITLCTDPEILNRISSDEVKANLYEVDLKAYADAIMGIYALEVRDQKLPNGTAREHFDSTQFYSDSQLLTASRWPKEDQEYQNTIGMKIKGEALTQYINYTKDGQFKTPSQIAAEGGMGDLPMNIFVFDNVYEKLKSWDVAGEDIYTVDYFANNWWDQMHKVVSFTDHYGDNGKLMYPCPERPESSPIALAVKGYFTTDYGRRYNSEMAADDAAGASNYRRWYFMNILEEISLNGEYYFDDENDKLYIYRTGTLAQENIYVSTLSEYMLFLDGEENNKFKNVSFVNMNFKQSQTGLIILDNCDNITFDGCEVGQNSGSGFHIEKSTNVTVKNTKIYETGMKAVTIEGCNEPSKTSELVNANILFDNCRFKDVSTVHGAYSYAMNINSSTGVTVKNSTFSGGAHGCIGWKLMSNFTFENNEVYDFITHTDDTGLFYDFGNVPTQIGIIFRNNLVHDIGSTWQTWGYNIWYQDSNSSGYTVYHNVVYNIGAGDDWVGTTPGSIFTKMKAGLVYDNVVFRTSSKFRVAYPHMNTDGTPADIVSGGDAFWYCNIHSEETNYNKSEPEWSDINNSGLETFWTVEDDDRRDFSYNKLRELRTEAFHDYLMSATVFEKSGASRWEKGASYFVQDVASYKDDDNKTQGLKQIKVTYKVQGATNTNRNAGYVATYDNGDFASFDDLYQLLWEDFGFAVNFNGTLPASGFEIKYRGDKIAKMYASIYTLVTPDNESTEEYDAVYKFSRAIELANEKYNAGFDLTNHHDDNLFKLDNHQTWGYSHILATLYSPGFYLGEYTNNLTVGLGYTFSTNPNTWRNGSYKVSDSYDNAAVDFLMVDANGNYTQDFLVFFQNQLDNNRIAGFELLDLSKVGCTLDD